MKKILIFVIFVWGSCSTKTPVLEPTFPEIDFSANNNYFTPTEISKFKGSINCDETPYWKGQKIKLQGFIYSGNIDVKAKKFFLYDNIKFFDSTTGATIVYYQSKDSITISKTLLENLDKHCLITASCLTKEVFIEKCQRLITFTLTKPEDLEFK
jgi:hypothetical protein